jgi:hypothetical protein
MVLDRPMYEAGELGEHALGKRATQGCARSATGTATPAPG